MVGTTISHYKVLEKIGEGGMGVVYRATDTKLNRDVALKILPEQFASDAQRMGRFQREAEVLASLCGPDVLRGATWTTDAPFRETAEVIERGGALGLAAIEMESAALYALAAARGLPIACLAHVTNTMATTPGDFEKGEAGGAVDALKIVEAVAVNLEAVLPL